MTNFVEINGHQIAYRRKGQGIPVLLIHGVASYSFLWNDVMDTLSADFDVLATDLLGCGDSDKPTDANYSIAAQADILMEFINKMGLDKVHLVGHDIGGGIVQIMAVKRPEQLLDLVMINPVGYDYWPVQPITTMRLPIIRTLTSSVMNRGMLAMVVRRAIYHKNKLTRELMDEFWAPLANQEGKDGFINLIRCINNNLLISIADKLRELNTPTLVIRGDADAYLSRAITERLVKDIPGAVLERVAQGGHFIQIDDPDKVSSLLKEFFLKTINSDEHTTAKTAANH